MGWVLVGILVIIGLAFGVFVERREKGGMQ